MAGIPQFDLTVAVFGGFFFLSPLNGGQKKYLRIQRRRSGLQAAQEIDRGLLDAKKRTLVGAVQ